MTDRSDSDSPPEASEFEAAQQQLMIEIGQALIAQSVGGTVAIDLLVTQHAPGDDVELDFRLDLQRQSGLTIPAAAEQPLVETVQRLVLLWREYGREPWRTLTYHLTRGESGPRFTSEFDF